MSRKVIFWGCGNTAKEIYCKYEDEITLLYGISNDAKETYFIPKPGKEFPVKRPERKGKKEEGMIVICSVQYETIAEQLSLLGYIPFVDFIDYELTEILWTGKRTVLLYGFCHLRGIADCLRGAGAFSESYLPVFYPNYLFLNFYQQGRLQYLADRCDVFVYGVALTQENRRKNEALLGRLRSHVKKLCLHTAFFGGYFPQKKRAYNDLNEYAVKSEGHDYTPFSYGDSWLNGCIAQGMGLDDIWEALLSEDVYGRDFILRYAEGEWKRLKFQEQESDFRIAGYLEENYRKRRLFRNEAHMENPVLWQYALQILQHLGCGTEMDMPDRPLFYCSQHFIYPCVARALGLEWDVLGEELDLYTYGGWRKVTVREYVRLYYESCSEIRKLKGKHLLP